MVFSCEIAVLQITAGLFSRFVKMQSDGYFEAGGGKGKKKECVSTRFLNSGINLAQESCGRVVS